MAHTCIHCGGRCSCDHDIDDMVSGMGAVPWCVGCGCEDDDELDALLADEEEDEEEKITDPFSKGSLDY